MDTLQVDENQTCRSTQVGTKITFRFSGRDYPVGLYLCVRDGETRICGVSINKIGFNNGDWPYSLKPAVIAAMERYFLTHCAPDEIEKLLKGFSVRIKIKQTEAEDEKRRVLAARRAKRAAKLATKNAAIQRAMAERSSSSIQ